MNESGGDTATIDCETAVMRLWDFLDGQLPASTRTEVEGHLATCALCPPHFGFARTMLRALAGSAPMPATDEAQSLVERVRTELQRQAAASDATHQ